MSTITVSIGRDTADGPLGGSSWVDFKARTRAAVTDAGLTPVFEGDGVGIWEEATEDSWTVVALGTPSGSLTRTLADLANRFNQEAIAVTTGETALVEARPLFAAVGLVD